MAEPPRPSARSGIAKRHREPAIAPQARVRTAHHGRSWRREFRVGRREPEPAPALIPVFHRQTHQRADTSSPARCGKHKSKYTNIQRVTLPGIRLLNTDPGRRHTPSANVMHRPKIKSAPALTCVTEHKRCPEACCNSLQAGLCRIGKQFGVSTHTSDSGRCNRCQGRCRRAESRQR